jgi:hypothetical protein
MEAEEEPGEQGKEGLLAGQKPEFPTQLPAVEKSENETGDTQAIGRDDERRSVAELDENGSERDGHESEREDDFGPAGDRE